MPVIRSDVEAIARKGRGTLHRAAGSILPPSCAGVNVEGPHPPIPVPDEDEAAGDEWRGLGRPDRPQPDDRSIPAVEGDDDSVLPRDVGGAYSSDERRYDKAARNRRRGPATPTAVEPPDGATSPRVERIEPAVERREE